MSLPLVARDDGRCHDCFKDAVTFDGLFCKRCLWERLKQDNAVVDAAVHEARGRPISIHPKALGGAADGMLRERDDE